MAALHRAERDDYTNGMLKLSGHQGTVHALAFAGRGRLVSAGRDGTIRVWDSASGRELARLEGHGGPVLCLAVQAEDGAIASGGADGTVKLWNMASGQLTQSLDKQMAAATGLAWIPNRRALLVACGERLRPERAGELTLCTINGKPSLRSMRVEENGFWSLAAARHAATVAWGGGARQVSAWDITQQQPKSFNQRTPSLAVALSDDGATLASATDRVVRVWNVERGQERAMLDGHRGMVRALAFSPDGRVLASGGQDQAVRFWLVTDAGVRPGPVYQWPIGAVHALTFSPDGLTAAAAGDSGDILIWDVEE